MRAKKENELNLLVFYFQWIFNGVISSEVVTKTDNKIKRRTYIGDMQLFLFGGSRNLGPRMCFPNERFLFLWGRTVGTTVDISE